MSKDKVLKDLSSIYGAGSIGRVKDLENIEIERIPCGVPSIDYIMGGGFPMGRIVEIVGEESTAKTSTCLHAMKMAQELHPDKDIVFIDAECSFDPVYANSIGIDTDEMILAQPECGEDALEMVEAIVRAGNASLIIVDSVAALVPRAEIDGEMGDSKMGSHARLMSQAMRKLTSALKKSNACLVFINQYRMKIGVSFGDPRVPTGGNALKFYASIRLDTSKLSAKDKDKEDGVAFKNTIKLKCIKNKTAPPWKVAEVSIEYGTGFCIMEDVLTNAVRVGLIDKRKGGHYHSPDGEVKYGHGDAQLLEFMMDNQELYESLKSRIFEPKA